MAFDSLLKALEGWFSASIAALPQELRCRVESVFAPDAWDKLSPDERRSVAAEWDDQHDPSAEPDRKLEGNFFNFIERKEKIKRDIKKLEAFSPTADTDLAEKNARIAERKKALELVEDQEHLWGEKLPDRHRQSSSAHAPSAQHAEGIPEYIPYPQAFKLLNTKLVDVTPQEMGAWVWLGRKSGGLAAYRKNATQLEPFFYVLGNPGDFDYLGLLMACWFNVEEINSFQPTDRFITGKALIDRWSKHAGIQPKAFIRGKVKEARLQDFYPMYGGTRWSFPNDDSLPPLKMALFRLAEVEAIEKAVFGEEETQSELAANTAAAATASQIRKNFVVIRSSLEANDKWWKSKLRDAKRNGLVKCRAGAGKKGRSGSLWRPDLVAGWLVDRHARGRDGLAADAARAALKKFPGCEEFADDWFQPNE